MRPRLNSRHVLMILVVGAVLTFQNCADPGNSTFSDGSSSGTSYTSSLPFAYSAKIDTISYMSCSGIQDAVEPRAYYSFRAGAYSSSTGGLSLTSDFLSQITHFSPTQKAQAFANSSLNSNTALNMSIRLVGNYQSVWSSGSLASGKDIDQFLPPLDSDDVAGNLADLQSGQQINYFPGSGNKRLMEASLRFYDYENVAQLTRNNLNSRSALLAVGYSNTSDAMDTALRGPDSTLLKSSVYGTGYFLHFSLPMNYAAGDIRVLSTNGVEEVNMQTGAYQTSTWDCGTNYQFMVVRPEDKAANRVVCNATVDRFSNSTQQAALAAIRRVLRVEDWYVDLDHHCVMPKGTGDYCYGDIGTRSVQYGVSSCSDTGTTVCPHFVSVCVRH